MGTLLPHLVTLVTAGFRVSGRPGGRVHTGDAQAQGMGPAGVWRVFRSAVGGAGAGSGAGGFAAVAPSPAAKGTDPRISSVGRRWAPAHVRLSQSQRCCPAASCPDGGAKALGPSGDALRETAPRPRGRCGPASSRLLPGRSHNEKTCRWPWHRASLAGGRGGRGPARDQAPGAPGRWQPRAGLAGRVSGKCITGGRGVSPGNPGQDLRCLPWPLPVLDASPRDEPELGAVSLWQVSQQPEPAAGTASLPTATARPGAVPRAGSRLCLSCRVDECLLRAVGGRREAPPMCQGPPTLRGGCALVEVRAS